MGKNFRHISKISLLIAAVILLAHLVIPHHHHGSKVIVLKEAIHSLTHCKLISSEDCSQSCSSYIKSCNSEKSKESCSDNHDSCWGKELWSKNSDEKGFKHHCGTHSSLVLCKHLLCSIIFYIEPISFEPPLRSWVAIEIPRTISLHEVSSPRIQSLRAPPYSA